MGQAFHRKKMSVGHAHTRGTGISYIEARLKPQGGKGLKAKGSAGVREWNVHCLMTIAGFELDKWEDERLNGADRNPDLERTVDRAFTIVNTAVTKNCDGAGIEVEQLLEALQRPRFRVEVMLACRAVREKFVSVFAQIGTDQTGAA
jgi:hypothetical protein